MKPMRSILARLVGAAGVATSIATLAGAAGAATAAAAPTTAASITAAPATAPGAAPAITGVVWTKLHLVNGWQSGPAIDDTGLPAWAVKNGVVYLAGELNQPSAGATEFATLPRAARPNRTLYIVVHVPSGSYAWLTIFRDGEMTDQSPTQSLAQSATELGGLSFPARSTTTRKLSLLHGWQSAQHAYGTGDPSYAVRGRVVYLAGSLQGPSTTKTTFAVLPRGARPAHVLWITVYTYGGTTGLLEIFPNGQMRASMGSARLFTSLADVSFPAAATKMRALKLINLWQSEQALLNTGNPAYAVAGGIVYLSGSLHQSTSYSDNFAVLPKAARPRHLMYLKVYTDGAVVGIIQIYPNGTLWAFSFPSANAKEFTSLAGISYPVNS